MVHIRRVPILLAVATLAWAPVAFSASPSTDAQHELHHPKEQPKKPAPAAAPAVAPQAKGNADLDPQIAHLRAIRERLSRANTPEERQALMAERNKVIQDAMAIMHKDMMGMGMAGPGGMPSPKGKTTTSQMQMCQDMMGQHMAFMQEMMQMNNQGMMSGGMGSGMGAAGMMGK
ncbi:hypothetical protein [Cupriavidus pinatubonensis]|uniref:Uncharacterized protein n=1 Tax=Cupriavidus pinatubonensis TaxID=248026 RepID=A0ABM8XU87_9BURK|nr:hypothetical protein [Cupriavidus pinatubonensis]CAG9183925.1 hypothetical protein LMG23994_05265 [Cupriavidus pinatubonensis]